MKRPSAVVEKEFRDRVTELGGRVIEPKWLGLNKPHRVVCKFGHEGTPTPSSVQSGRGICRTCAGKDPGAAWLAFRHRVAELGGQVIEPAWLGCQTPHRVICAAGHEASPMPNTVQQGRGICRTCAGNDTRATEQAFRKRMAELGAQITEPEWLGAKYPHRIICPQGHLAKPRPSDVLKGHGLCLTCAGKDPAVTEKAFREGIAKLGGRVVEPTWLGARKLHRIICGNGHEILAHPATLARGGEICSICTGRAPGMAWQAFRDRVRELGGRVVEPEWLGNAVGHRVICKEGHECAPLPAGVQQGQGLCRICAGMFWDIFYVVANDAAGTVKFGVTSHDARPRLLHHRRSGFGRIIMTITDLADAYELEQSIIATLGLAAIKPVRGREYYDLSALPVILDIADNWAFPGDGQREAA
jgi:formylmethanofuran dehydrogenase subunit E